jgi:hypothetical protein
MLKKQKISKQIFGIEKNKQTRVDCVKVSIDVNESLFECSSFKKKYNIRK